ncbi:M12 family metallopeptidase [Pleionea sp. CnH1-48]|uniref:M12 family metallopeptidase n=1 Tax=Pleionea sp. CnH1-48 TaxID=2954494 RepID=UPI00209730EC|nr:M12 family metallopeptidase [Pleionea sp. CnH1-48]MCO7227183.1 M12 family metallopeptidase [Pleionea sp. CnH1-48]
MNTKLILSLILIIVFYPSSNYANNLTPDRSKSNEPIWGYSSEGRELVDIMTSTGDIIQVVDVDGLAYSGDMILGKTEDLKKYGLNIVSGQEFSEDTQTGPLAAIRYPSSGYKWPNGVVPYVFASNLGSRARQDMEYAFNHWHSKTNVRFVRRTSQRDYLTIQGGGGCSSYVGRQGGSQAVTLADGCGRGAAVHELGHAVGFFHEQTRTDRDSYVTIYWNNIQSGMAFNFNKISSSDGTNHGQYDYYSIMHYGTRAFGINGAVTIWPTRSGVDTNAMGNTSVLSSGDIAAAAAIYGNGGGGGNGETYTGNLSGANDADIQPDGNWFQYSGGNIKASLQGPNGTDFDLYLYRWNGSNWSEVAKSISPQSIESIDYNASAGYYYFRIHSYSGSGRYTFTLQK